MLRYLFLIIKQINVERLVQSQSLKETIYKSQIENMEKQYVIFKISQELLTLKKLIYELIGVINVENSEIQL